MTQAQKIQYVKIAADLCQFHFTHEHMDLLVSLYELIMKKEGNADMRDVATIQAQVKHRAIEANKKTKRKR